MPSTIQPYQKPRIKDPGSDPVIAMARERRRKELEIESQKLSVAGLSGGVLHKQLELDILEKDIKQIEEGVQEYQDRSTCSRSASRTSKRGRSTTARGARRSTR